MLRWNFGARSKFEKQWGSSDKYHGLLINLIFSHSTPDPPYASIIFSTLILVSPNCSTVYNSQSFLCFRKLIFEVRSICLIILGLWCGFGNQKLLSFLVCLIILWDFG